MDEGCLDEGWIRWRDRAAIWWDFCSRKAVLSLLVCPWPVLISKTALLTQATETLQLFRLKRADLTLCFRRQRLVQVKEKKGAVRPLLSPGNSHSPPAEVYPYQHTVCYFSSMFKHILKKYLEVTTQQPDQTCLRNVMLMKHLQQLCRFIWIHRGYTLPSWSCELKPHVQFQWPFKW